MAAGLAAVYAIAPLQGRRWWLGALLGLAALVAVAPVTVRRLAAVRTSATPVFAVAEALLLVVAMVVFGFSALYLAIAHHDGQFEGLRTRVDAVYFTVTTLSTVGYGDVHAVGRGARAAVTMQILLDLTVIAGAVKLLMSAARRPGHS
jgi:nitrate reductase gamma subunit